MSLPFMCPMMLISEGKLMKSLFQRINHPWLQAVSGGSPQTANAPDLLDFTSKAKFRQAKFLL